MKELSIEEKAKAYDEALERAKQLPKISVAYDRFTIERIFPELKESEDERIRKKLIELFHDTVSNDEIFSDYGLDKTKVLAWLEKQKEFVSADFGDVWETADCDELTAPLEKYSKDAIKEMCHAWYDKGIELERKSWLEKQGEKELVNYDEAEKEKADFVGDGFIKCFANFLDFKEGETYWLEYIGDDKYNVRSDNLLGKTYHITPCQLYTVFKKLTWLEKQGEQNKQVYFPKFTLDDVLALQCCMETAKKVQEDKELYEKLNLLHGKVYDAYQLEKQCENPQGKTALEAVKEEKVDNQNCVKPADKVEPKFKVGDKIQYSKGCDTIMTIEKIENGEYVFANNMGHTTIEWGNNWCLVEQKPAWSEEDEDNFKHLLDEIVCLGNNRNSANRLYYDRLIKFIEELKNRAQPKEKWCDKDERMLDRLIAYFEKQVAFTDDDNPRYADWLKSLKHRNTWKPSEWQIETLKKATHIVGSKYKSCLASLYQDLKKLKG